jgi:hypothetical protein
MILPKLFTPSVSTFAAPAKEIAGYILSSVVMRIKNSIGTERGNTINKLSVTFSILQAHKKTHRSRLHSSRQPGMSRR